MSSFLAFCFVLGHSWLIVLWWFSGEPHRDTHLHTHFTFSQVGFPHGSAGEESARKAGDLGWEDPPEKGTATHSSILAWGIPWTV